MDHNSEIQIITPDDLASAAMTASSNVLGAGDASHSAAEVLRDNGPQGSLPVPSAGERASRGLDSEQGELLDPVLVAQVCRELGLPEALERKLVEPTTSRSALRELSEGINGASTLGTALTAFSASIEETDFRNVSLIAIAIGVGVSIAATGMPSVTAACVSGLTAAGIYVGVRVHDALIDLSERKDVLSTLLPFS